MRQIFRNTKPGPASRLNSRSEYHENQRLMRELEGDDPREGFNKALRTYEQADISERVKLIEAVIRTSRGVGDDDAALPRDLRQCLVAIKIRYALFASAELPSDARTYREARHLITLLFF